MWHDEGVLIFFIIVPLVYPLLYSWIYNNETVHDVPVAVVDLSHSQESRKFIRMCDASADVHVAYWADDLDDAQSLVSRQLVKGIYYIPSDFSTRLNRMEQGVVSVYCDMALMLTYKAIYQTAVAVSQQMGADIQKKVSGSYTVREEMITARPLEFDEVTMFNPQGGRADIDSAADTGAGHWLGCWYGAREEPLWRPGAHPSLLRWGGARGGWQEPRLPHGLCRDGCLPHYDGAAHLQFPATRHLAESAHHDGALCAGLRILRHDRVVPCSLSRECHVAGGVRISAAALCYGCVVASVGHSWRLAGCVVALPQYLRCQGLCAHELHGSHR